MTHIIATVAIDHENNLIAVDPIESDWEGAKRTLAATTARRRKDRRNFFDRARRKAKKMGLTTKLSLL